ncbi:MAG: DUF2812 domain-containing protein [Sporolactobacillus sp.]
MRKIVYKLYWDYEKEEAWLNRMVETGWALVHYSVGRYVFDACPSGAYIYRIELLDQAAKHRKSKDYLTLLEESGIEHIASYANWIYLRKRADQGPFELYSDLDSRIAHYRKIKKMWLALTLAEGTVAFVNIGIGLLILGHNAMTWFSLTLIAASCVLAVFFVIYLRRIGKKIGILEEERLVRE